MNKVIAKKWFGQNFLIDEQICFQIVNLIDLNNKNVIEIGPGQGALTKFLIKKAKFVKAFEIDNDLFKLLNQNLKTNNLEIINEDFLNASLNESKNQIIIGNIPYNITTEILFKLIENYAFIDTSILMVQDEVANRIVALSNSKEYGKLSVVLQTIATCTKEIFVPKNKFNPQPKVNSAVVKIVFNKEIDIPLNFYLEFVKLIFQFKRKTLVNNLKTKYSMDKINDVFSSLKFKFNIRTEQLTIEQIKQLFFILNN